MTHRPLLTADWVEVVFLHYRVDPRRLRDHVPIELDLFDGDAYVSLVAFTQRRLRPSAGGNLAAWLSAPLASHEFLNVRTYVRCGETRGIFFLAEWIPNRLAVAIGPRTYGLPYRLGKLAYRNFLPRCSGRVSSGGTNFRYRAEIEDEDRDDLDEFLLERYTAFTHRDGVVRRFDVDHAPWPSRGMRAEVIESALLRLSGEWWREALLVSANYSPGVRDVRISKPKITSRLAPRCRA